MTILPFPENLIPAGKFKPIGNFTEHAPYQTDFESRKLAWDEEQAKLAETASDVSAVMLTLVRLSIKPSQRGGRYTYRIMDGLPKQFQDPTTTALWGEAGTEREHSIFYSKQELGVTTTKNGIITPTPFKHLVHFIVDDSSAKYANGDTNPSFGKFVPHFPTDDSDIEQTKTLLKAEKATQKIDSILGFNKNTVIIAGTKGEIDAKEASRMRIAHLYASINQKAPVMEDVTATP